MYHLGVQISGVYKIDPDDAGEFEVYCDHERRRRLDGVYEATGRLSGFLPKVG